MDLTKSPKAYLLFFGVFLVTLFIEK